MFETKSQVALTQAEVSMAVGEYLNRRMLSANPILATYITTDMNVLKFTVEPKPKPKEEKA